MSFQSYKQFWDDKARTRLGALAAVDGSMDEDVVRATGRYTAGQVRAALELSSSDRVLELGCGVGRIGRELAPHVAFWQGVDISSNMVGVARERLKDFPNTGADVLERTSLERFADASFDKAYCVAVFIHMDKEDFFLYLRELARVLKPGGRLYFDCWNLAHPIGWKRFAYEVAQHVNADPGARKDVARNQFCTPQEVSIYLRHAGFDEILVLDDSPQLQAIASVPGGENALDVAARLALSQGRIVYSPRWAHLFDRLLHVIYDGAHPGELYAQMDPKDPDPEVPVFRAWLRAFWKQGEAQWGPAPAGP